MQEQLTDTVVSECGFAELQRQHLGPFLDDVPSTHCSLGHRCHTVIMGRRDRNGCDSSWFYCVCVRCLFPWGLCDFPRDFAHLSLWGPFPSVYELRSKDSLSRPPSPSLCFPLFTTSCCFYRICVVSSILQMMPVKFTSFITAVEMKILLA